MPELKEQTEPLIQQFIKNNPKKFSLKRKHLADNFANYLTRNLLKTECLNRSLYTSLYVIVATAMNNLVGDPWAYKDLQKLT